MNQETQILELAARIEAGIAAVEAVTQAPMAMRDAMRDTLRSDLRQIAEALDDLVSPTLRPANATVLPMAVTDQILDGLIDKGIRKKACEHCSQPEAHPLTGGVTIDANASTKATKKAAKALAGLPIPCRLVIADKADIFRRSRSTQGRGSASQVPFGPVGTRYTSKRYPAENGIVVHGDVIDQDGKRMLLMADGPCEGQVFRSYTEACDACCKAIDPNAGHNSGVRYWQVDSETGLPLKVDK